MEEKTIKSSSLTLDLHLLECPICLSTLVKPITLQCGHNFCETCLKNPKFYSSKQCCPVCRRPILSSMKHFKENILLQVLLKARMEQDEEYQRKLCSVQNFKYSQNKSIWIKLLKKWFRVVKAIFKSMSKMIPGFTLVLAIILLLKLKYEILNIDTKKMEMIYSSQLNKLVNTIRNPNLKAADSEINMQTLVFSKLMKYLFTNYIRFSLPS